jgi:hypothetical protein
MPNPVVNHRLTKKRRVSALTTFPITDSWIARCIANGGVGPTAPYIAAFHAFENTITLAGISTQIQAMCFFVGYDKISGLTPYIAAVGNGSGGSGRWFEQGWPIQLLSGCGYANNGVPVNSSINTGVTTNMFAFGHIGIEIYWSQAATPQGSYALGCSDGSGTANTTHFLEPSDTGAGSKFRWALGETPRTGGNQQNGYLSIERTSASRADAYYLNSGQPTLTSLDSSTNTITDGRTNFYFPVFNFNFGGSLVAPDFDRVYGMISFTTGLSAADSQTLGTAVQTLEGVIGCAV